jgi:alkylation response protein AidB-like acyl-CoA dehydrogenase
VAPLSWPVRPDRGSSDLACRLSSSSLPAALTARAFADSRVQAIFGGTTEIMKEIIGRGLGV